MQSLPLSSYLRLARSARQGTSNLLERLMTDHDPGHADTDDQGPLPSSADVSARQTDRALSPGPLTLETILIGPLTVPDDAARAAELEEMSHRAAIYATHAQGRRHGLAYRVAWRQYEAWRTGLGRNPLAADSDTIAM
jgi:hypothetical protein